MCRARLVGSLLPSLALTLVLGLPRTATRATPATAGGTGPATVPAVAVRELQVADVLGRIPALLEKGDWKNAGWTDPVIDEWLGQVTAAVAALSPAHPVRVPVRLADLPNRGQPRPGLAREGNLTLVVAPQFTAPFLSRSIVLATGDVQVSHCSDCVILAGGAVRVSHGSGNVIVANHLIAVGHDGSARRAAVAAADAGGGGNPNSLLLTPGSVAVAHASGSVIAAREADVSHANGCLFVNVENRTVSHENGCAALRSSTVPIGAVPRHPLADRLRADWTADDKGAVIRLGDRRYVADLNAPILDEAGKPVDELAGWALTVADSDFAVLSNSKERATVVLKAPRRK